MLEQFGGICSVPLVCQVIFTYHRSAQYKHDKQLISNNVWWMCRWKPTYTSH